jgi:hypothetical protein
MTKPSFTNPAVKVESSRRKISFRKITMRGTARSEARQAQTGRKLDTVFSIELLQVTREVGEALEEHSDESDDLAVEDPQEEDQGCGGEKREDPGPGRWS